MEILRIETVRGGIRAARVSDAPARVARGLGLLRECFQRPGNRLG